jgi:hypothetical protein
MTSLWRALPVLVLTVACGARRAAPEPAFPQPLSTQVRDLRVQSGELVGVLVLSNGSSRPMRVARLDWSAGSLGVRVEGDDLSLLLPASGALDLPLRGPLGPSAPPSLPGSVRVQGTVYVEGGSWDSTTHTFSLTGSMTGAVPPSVP